VNKVTQLSVSDSNSISTIASTLSSLTQVPNQVSSNMAVNYFFLLFKNPFLARIISRENSWESLQIEILITTSV
jgi:hypothetical protein